MADTMQFDVFLSHSTKDKPLARELATKLRDDGIKVWFDEWQVRPGDLIGKRIEEGLESSRTLVLLMSRNAFASDWATLEAWTFRFRDPTNTLRRFIPTRLDDADVPSSLMLFAYVDWRDRSDQQYQQLLSACQPPTVAHAPDRPARGAQALPPVSSTGTHLDPPRNAKTKFAHQINGLSITPDGRTAVAAITDKTVRVWDIETRQTSAVLKGHTREVICVAVSSDGRRAVSGAYDNTVRVWDIQKATCDCVLKGHSDSVRAIALAPEAGIAVSSGWDHCVMVWDVKDGKRLRKMPGHTEAALSVAITPDGSRAVTGGYDKTVRVWDLRSGQVIAVLVGHSQAVDGVALSSDGRLALSCGSWDKTLRVWDVEKGKMVFMLNGPAREVSNVALTPDGRYAVSGGRWGPEVFLWDLPLRRIIQVFDGSNNELHGLAITPNASHVAASFGIGGIRIWRTGPQAGQIKKVPNKSVDTYGSPGADAG